MRNLDTTERITMLCDGDKRDIEEHNQSTIEELRFEYFMYLYHNGDEELTKAVMNVVKFWEEKKKVITELWDKIKDALQVPIEPLSKSLTNRQRIWRENHNNYRKLHHLPQIRWMRCRWRPRENRRRLEGLSPGVVIIDEYHNSDCCHREE